MKLFDVLAHQRRLILLIVGLLTVVGLWCALRLPSAIYPELQFQRVQVVIQGSALGARQMVFSATRPVEEAVSVVPGVVRVDSRTIRGALEMSINFDPRTNMVNALSLVRARINQVQGDLPQGLDIEVEQMTPSLFPILSYTVEGGDPATLYDIARYQIKPILSRIPGVARVEVQGSDIHEVEVVADPSRLAGLGLTYDDLANAIRKATTVAAVGRVARDYRQYLVVTDVEAHTPEDIGAVVLSNGLRVRDVATVSLGTEDRLSIIAGDGKPAAQISVTRQLGGNSIAIADSVAGAFRALHSDLPAGVEVKAVYDQASLVQDAVHGVRDAMLIGAILAVIVLFLFLRHGRITAISATSIPLTLIITVAAMRALGQTFNLMTLGAMAIAIGLVIDDAVVITENIARHLATGAERHIAIREAVAELVWPVTTSTITTVVVFLPLGLLTGVVGQFFAALATTLTCAVLISLGLALTIIPLLANQLVTTEEAAPSRAGSVLNKVTGALTLLTDWYGSTLDKALHHPRRVVGALAALAVLGVVGYEVIGTGFLPEMDEGAFVLDYFTPGGTALAETDREVRVAEGILARTPEITGTSRRTGAELGLFATLQNRGDIVARLTPANRRERDIFAVINAERDSISAAVPRLHIEFVQILSDVINDLAGAAKPVEIKVFGENLDTLEAYAHRLEPKLSAVEGLADYYNGVSEPSAELMLKVRSADAARAGLTPEDVGAGVQGALLGVTAGEIHTQDRPIGVRVRAPDEVRSDLTRLASLPLLGAHATRPTPLGALADFQPVDSRAELLRENQQQMIDINADVDQRSLGDVMADVRKVLAVEPVPAGVRIVIGGQYANQQDAFAALLVVLGLATLSVVAVMVVQFESFLEPLIVLAVAPVSFTGGLAALLVTGTDLNVSSMMGFILLVGLIVKNGIILLDFTRLRMRRDGLNLEAALRDAARVRLRPILMTTLCTLFGLLPLALGLGAGSELQRPLALTVIGGLALSTPITLYAVPALLVAIRRGSATLPRA